MDTYPAKLWLCSAIALAVINEANAETNSTGIELKGILATSTQRLAMFELAQPRPPHWGGPIFLTEHQREGDISVAGIDVRTGTGKVRHGDHAFEIGFKVPSADNASNQALQTLRLEKAGPDLVFRLYQVLANRTVLRPAGLPFFELDLVDYSVSDADLAKAIESALAKEKILFRPDRDKFVIAGRQEEMGRVPDVLWDWAHRISPQKRVIDGHVPGHGAPPGEEILPAGAINFPRTDLNQVLQIFQELTGKTVLRPSALPSPAITLQTSTPLTRAEANYAFGAMLALNGISIAPAHDDFLLVFPTFHSNHVAKVLARDMKAVRAVGASSTEPLPAASLDIHSDQLDQVAELYGNITGQVVQIAASNPRPRLVFRTQTSLRPESMLCGLDLLLGLNNLAVVPKEPGPGLEIVPWAVMEKVLKDTTR